MKNFKKVLSAVLALAMTISSFAAVSASNFSDVADTAAYAEAVDVLSALGIVTGYEDGTFKPEGAITRAETATMIVGALNMSEDAKASAGTSQFADVNTEAAWATGYVNVGVAQGFINGMDATTFAPQQNVTYAQMCVMLTSIAGYGEYAAASNSASTDWSYGYTTMAAATGINKGVSVAKDTALTRGQVAQMIYNTLVTPKLGVAEYSLTGNTYSQLDGKNGRDFQTLLAEKFDGYVATVTVADTATSDPTLENGYAKVNITKADWWPEIEANVTTTNPQNGKTVLVDASMDMNAYLLQSGKAILVLNEEEDEYELVYFAANSRVETKEFEASDYTLQSELGAANQLSYAGKLRLGSKSYTLDDTVDIYVNGVNTTTLTIAGASVATLDSYEVILDQWLGGAQGTIKLVKGINANGYSQIFVNAYEIAKVTSVTYSNNRTTVWCSPKTTLGTGTAGISKIVIDDDKVEDGDVVISVMNGDAAMELKDLAKNDVIAIAKDFSTAETSVTNPKEITVLVSRDTVSGKITGKDTTEKTVTIDGKEYSVVDWSGTTLTTTTSYTLTLDPFGRIFSADQDSTATNYAILEKYSSTNETVTLVLADGTVKTYDLDVNNTVLANIPVLLYANGVNGAKNAPADRVVEYTIKNSTGKLTNLTQAIDYLNNSSDVEYNERNGRLGSVQVNASTKVIDATDYYNATSGSTSDYKATTLTDGTEYVAYAFRPNNQSTYASLVLIERVGTVFTEDSRFAVVVKAPVSYVTTDDDDCYMVEVLYNGQEVEMLMDLSYTGGTLATGDAFYFTKDSDDLIDKVYKVYAHDSTYANNFSSFTALSVPANYYKPATDREGWRFVFNDVDNNTDIALAYGIVVDVDHGIDFAPIPGTWAGAVIDSNVTNAAGDASGVYNFAMSSDAVIYSYNVNDNSVNREYEKVTIGNVVESRLDGFEWDTVAGAYSSTATGAWKIPAAPATAGGKTQADAEGGLTYALAMIVNGAVVEIYTIQQ